MPRYELQEVKDIQLETLEKLRNQEEFERFLRTAAHLHRYSFHEQVLIYAQRPEVTAVAPIEVWNKNIGRYPRKGSKGIAVIKDESVHYVFDVSDTDPYQPQQKAEQISWDFPKEHQADIFKALEQKFGECYVDYDNHSKFIWELVEKVCPTFREQQIIAYMVTLRLGYEPDFELYYNFKSIEEVAEVGTQTGKYTRIILDEFRKQSKIFAKEKDLDYTKEKNVEEATDNGIHDSRGLSDTEHSGEHRTAENIRKMGATPQEVPERRFRMAIQSDVDERGNDSASERGGHGGAGTSRNADETVGNTDPAASTGNNGVGSMAEPTAPSSGRDSNKPYNRTNSVNIAKTEEIEKPPFFVAEKLPSVAEQLSFFGEKPPPQTVKITPDVIRSFRVSHRIYYAK